jgi:hypothetical protein
MPSPQMTLLASFSSGKFFDCEEEDECQKSWYKLAINARLIRE